MFGNAMGGGAIPVDYQQQMGGCCNEPITGAITEPEETLNSSGNDSGGGEVKKNAPLSTEDYFDYDANVESPLSPQGISPPRKNTLVSASSDNNNGSSSSSSSTFQWKSAVNRLWSEISRNTCRCFGEPFSPSRSSSGEAIISGSDENTTSSKWKMLSSVTTSATSATTDVYSNNTSAAAQGVSKLKRTPMFSSPVDA